MKISGVIITYNEEDNLGRCIDSMQDVVDEVLVVDSFSTDGTREIAEQLGARFICHAFVGHIEQKNYAMKKAQHDWVLSLDADEALDDQAKASITRLRSDGAAAHAYSFNRLNNYCGKWIKHAGWYPDKKLRLWHKSAGKWGGENPHDRVELLDGQAVAHLKGDILHYSYHSLSQHIKQVDYFTDISSRAAYKAGQRSSIFKILVNPAFKFVRDYVLKLGFLDGFYGFVIAIVSSFATFSKYTKLYQLQKEKHKS